MLKMYVSGNQHGFKNINDFFLIEELPSFQLSNAIKLYAWGY